MKIQGKISILINRDETIIEIVDDNANTTFCVVKLTPAQLSMALSRQSLIDCEVEVHGLDRIGKTHENKMYEFEIPESLSSSKHEIELQEIAQSQLHDGWKADRYFSSQNTFFKKDGKHFARVTIRRYV